MLTRGSLQQRASEIRFALKKVRAE